MSQFNIKNNSHTMIENIHKLRKEYLFHPLSEDEIGTNPYEQFTGWFEDAIRAKVDEPNAMVLSTSDLEGNISARVVLLKGIEKGGFVFFSNYASRKGSQLAVNPNAALTFLWKEIGRQVRIEGSVKKISHAASKTYYNSRPMESRISALISPQSSVIPDRAFLEALRKGVLLDLGDSEPECPSEWGGYILRPKLVEFWQGREYRLHDRLQYRFSGRRWLIERLAP